jgi:hypothetical protein
MHYHAFAVFPTPRRFTRVVYHLSEAYFALHDKAETKDARKDILYRSSRTLFAQIY